MNWLKKLFRSKSGKKGKINRGYSNDDSSNKNNNDLFDPMNILSPISPISIWNNTEEICENSNSTHSDHNINCNYHMKN